MLSLRIPSPGGKKRLNILCLGAHCDDIEIGCGGTLLALLQSHNADVTWATFSGTDERVGEYKASSKRFLRRAEFRQALTWDFPDGRFPGHFSDIKNAIETLKDLPKPDLIFSHERNDRHQDHRVIAELTWNTFRDHLILEYEIPKYEGGLTTPNAFVELSRAQVERKIRILLDCYKTQTKRRWFSDETFRSLIRIRGIEANAKSGFAEGFHVEKLVIE